MIFRLLFPSLIFAHAAPYIISSQDDCERGKVQSIRLTNSIAEGSMGESENGLGQAADGRMPEEMMKEAAHAICFFIPPDGWECAQPKNRGAPIQIGFVGKGKSDFHPSLNLATEAIDVSLKEYLKAVRTIHETEMNVKWRDLGPFTFRTGIGRLTEITSQCPMGEVKMLQGILIQDGTAYILTGAVLKEEFLDQQNAILSAMRSLSVVSDLFSVISDEPKKEALRKRFESYNALSDDPERQKEWKHLQKIVLEDYASFGGYWHFLVLKEGYQRIFPGPQMD